MVHAGRECGRREGEWEEVGCGVHGGGGYEAGECSQVV